jgi:hypothetical protein
VRSVLTVDAPKGRVASVADDCLRSTSVSFNYERSNNRTIGSISENQIGVSHENFEKSLGFGSALLATLSDRL